MITIWHLVMLWLMFNVAFVLAMTPVARSR